MNQGNCFVNHWLTTTAIKDAKQLSSVIIFNIPPIWKRYCSQTRDFMSCEKILHYHEQEFTLFYTGVLHYFEVVYTLLVVYREDCSFCVQHLKDTRAHESLKSSKKICLEINKAWRFHEESHSSLSTTFSVKTQCIRLMVRSRHDSNIGF